MGAFKEMMEKSHRIDKDARSKQRLELMARYGLTMRDLEDGKWEIKEEGPFGHTTLKLYKLVETVSVKVESQVRAVSEVTTEPDDTIHPQN